MMISKMMKHWAKFTPIHDFKTQTHTNTQKYRNRIKLSKVVIYEKPTANTTFNVERLTAFSLILGTKQYVLITSIQHCTGKTSYCNKAKQKVKLTLFIDLENLDNSKTSY